MGMLLLVFSAVFISGFIKVFVLSFTSVRTKIKSWLVLEENIFSLMLQCTLLAILNPSLRNYLDEILNSWLLDIKKSRFHILAFCLSPLTLWPIFLFLLIMYFFGNNLFYFFMYSRFVAVWTIFL